MAHYRILAEHGLTYPPHPEHKIIPTGSIVADIPEGSVRWLKKAGYIELVPEDEVPADNPAPRPVKSPPSPAAETAAPDAPVVVALVTPEPVPPEAEKPPPPPAAATAPKGKAPSAPATTPKRKGKAPSAPAVATAPPTAPVALVTPEPAPPEAEKES